MFDAPDGSRSHSGRRRRRYMADARLLAERIKAAEQGRTRRSPERSRHASLPSADWRTLTVDNLLHRLLRHFRRAFRVIMFLYAAFFALVMLGLHQWGQENLTTAALMYLPPLVWMAPVVALASVALFFDRKSLVLLSAAAIWFIFVHLDYNWRGGSAEPSLVPRQQLRVLTWNRGQSRGVSLQEIKNELQPDIILIQDSPKVQYYKGNPGYVDYMYVAGVGEFVLLSRFPILSAEPIGFGMDGSSSPFAAKFGVLIYGTSCAVYGVHLPSPRDALGSYKRGAFLWGILGFAGSPWEAKKQFYSQFWDQQIAMARTVAYRAREEAVPVIVAGDFNGPSHGPIYGMFSDFMQDSHREAGEAFGFTFPGETNNPAALFRPWLRLDQIFASPDWEVLESRPHPASAQHLPVFALLQLTGPGL